MHCAQNQSRTRRNQNHIIFLPCLKKCCVHLQIDLNKKTKTNKSYSTQIITLSRMAFWNKPRANSSTNTDRDDDDEFMPLYVILLSISIMLLVVVCLLFALNRWMSWEEPQTGHRSERDIGLQEHTF